MEQLSFDFIEIKYPELNETGYITSPEVIKTGQLRLEQAIARKKACNCDNFITWGQCVELMKKNEKSK